MNTNPTTEAEHTAPLTVDTEGLARLLGMSRAWVEKRVTDRGWLTGAIPVPFEIGARRRLWLRSAVIRWAEDVQARSEARVQAARGGGGR